MVLHVLKGKLYLVAEKNLTIRLQPTPKSGAAEAEALGGPVSRRGLVCSTLLGTGTDRHCGQWPACPLRDGVQCVRGENRRFTWGNLR